MTAAVVTRDILRPSDPGLRLNIGIPGSGKTYTIRNQVERAAHHYPVLVLDRMEEWSEVPADIPSAGALTVDDAIKHIDRGARLVVVRPRDLQSAAEQAAQWAGAYPGLAGVAIPEAHNVAPSSGRLHPAIADLACVWRHRRISAWLDTQRVALLSRTITEQARELRIFATVGDRDLSVISEMSADGKALVASVRECAKRYAQGEPGWHIRLGLIREPPYAPTRSP